MDQVVREWVAVAVRHPGSYPGLATWFTVGVGLGVAASNAVRSQWRSRDDGESTWKCFRNQLHRLVGFEEDDLAVESKIMSMESSIKQINHMRDTSCAVGFMICRGSNLDVVKMDATLLQMLFSKEDEHSEEDVDFSWESMKTNPKYAAHLPKHVHQLVSPHFRETHWKLVDMASNTEKVFPSSLMHPLRSVEVVKPDGDAILANISIGVLTQERQIYDNDCYFYAMICPIEVNTKAASEEERVSEVWLKAASMMYGRNVVNSVVSGYVPPPEEYKSATILQLDIVDYTRTCSRTTPNEVAKWMSKVHMVIDQVIGEFHIRKLETRGDSCFCVSGTNSVTSDLCATQMSRMVGFASKVSRLLCDELGTDIRCGVATGPVTIAYIGTRQFVPTTVAIGSTCEEASTLEQNGAPGLIRLSKKAAKRLMKETLREGTFVDKGNFDLLPTYIDTSSKNPNPAYWYDCVSKQFVRMHGPQVMPDGFACSTINSLRRDSKGDAARLKKVVDR